MRWSAVIAGAVFSLGLWLLLQTFGMGVGLTAVDTNDAGTVRGAGIGTGIWTAIAPLIAMFAGGILAGRLAGTREPRVGAMHGSVQWALTAVFGAYLMVSIISSLASGVTRVGSSVVSATATATRASPGIIDNLGERLGVDSQDLLGPVNQKLRDQGKPAITSEQLEAALRGAAQRGLRDGKLDREVLAQELAAKTALSRADVDDLAAQLEAKSSELSSRMSAMGAKAEHAALKAADATGKGLLMASLALLLGLAASAGGGALGARMAARHYRPIVVRGRGPAIDPDLDS